MTVDEMVVWHHQLDGHEFEQAQELVMDRKAEGSLKAKGMYSASSSEILSSDSSLQVV